MRARGPEAIVSAFSRPHTVSSWARFCAARTRLMPRPRAEVTQVSRVGTGAMLATSSSTIRSRRGAAFEAGAGVGVVDLADGADEQPLVGGLLAVGAEDVEGALLAALLPAAG